MHRFDADKQAKSRTAAALTDLLGCAPGSWRGPARVALGHEAREATDAVAAHLRLAAIRVVDAHVQVHPIPLRWQRKYHLIPASGNVSDGSL